MKEEDLLKYGESIMIKLENEERFISAPG